MSIHVLPPVTKEPEKVEPCQKCIEFLQSLLTRAESGDIQQVGVAYITEGQGAGTGYVSNGDLQLLGAVCRLQFRISGDT